MIDIKVIRENPERFKKAAADKRIDCDIDRLLAIDQQLAEVKRQLQDIATEKNKVGKSIAKMAPDQRQVAAAQLAQVKEQEAGLEKRVKELTPSFDELMLQVAQPADDDVPLGKDDTENVELRREGEVRKFDFEPKDHVQLGAALDIIDMERGVKLAGTPQLLPQGRWRHAAPGGPAVRRGPDGRAGVHAHVRAGPGEGRGHVRHRVLPGARSRPIAGAGRPEPGRHRRGAADRLSHATRSWRRRTCP